MDIIILNQVDNCIIRVFMGAASSFLGGLGVVLFVKLFLWKALKLDIFAAMIMNLKGD